MTLDSNESLVKTIDLIEMPQTFDGLLRVLRLVLAKPFISSLSLEVGKPIRVVWFKDIHDSILLSPPEVSPESVLSSVELEEFPSADSLKELIVDALLYMDQQRWFSTHMLVGSINVLKDFLGLPKMVSFPAVEHTQYHNFMGMRLIEVSSLPEEVVIILGATVPSAPLSEVKKGLKLVL